MVNSRNPKDKQGICGFLPPDDLCVAVEACLSQARASARVAVGLSGGPDSSALAIASQLACQRLGLDLHLFHVHHGLHDQANAWMQTVSQLAALLSLPLTTRQVSVDLHGGKGIEAAARQARHAALKEMAKDQGVSSVLLAHHAQDQAETVLMRLLRGAGVTGLAAMRPVSSPWAFDGVQLLRPWLAVDRSRLLAMIEGFSERTGWQPVDDPSNRDAVLARGALRQTILPAIQARWPAWSKTLSRHAQQAGEVDELLGQYGEQLLGDVSVAEQDAAVIDLLAWRGLTPPQQALVLRVWLARQQVALPTDASLQELMRQLRGLHALGHDRAMQWRHSTYVVTCVRGQVRLQVADEPDGAAEVTHDG